MYRWIYSHDEVRMIIYKDQGKAENHERRCHGNGPSQRASFEAVVAEWTPREGILTQLVHSSSKIADAARMLAQKAMFFVGKMAIVKRREDVFHQKTASPNVQRLNVRVHFQQMENGGRKDHVSDGDGVESRALPRQFHERRMHVT